MAETVRLRNITDQDRHVGSMDGRIAKADCLIEIPGRVVTDPAEIARALALGEGVSPNVADDVVYVLAPDGQLQAWPTATWKLESASKVKE